MPKFLKIPSNSRVLLWILLLSLLTEARGNNFPLRLVAGSDVLELQYGTYAVREFLDLYNDHSWKEIKVNRILANTWIGHKIDNLQENWMDSPTPIIIPPKAVVRIAERQRVVAGKLKRNIWVRWIRFVVDTDQGKFISNFSSSPLKPPGKVLSIIPAPNIDSLSFPTNPPSKLLPNQ